ncbi:aromatic acid exporter family protein [Streptomyces sp. NBC_00445]|uniref:FUSC family protein n=1 Tax=Streptomyces sp. NBC_00445 TaxID=2975745 RepID=UPI002E1DD377
MWHSLTWEATSVCRSVRRCVTARGPERYTTVQSLKTAGAALVAWALAGWWWDAPMALLAPWTALFLVQSTVYRSLLSALQQFVVVVAGTLLAAGGGVLLQNTMAAMAVVLPLTVLLGNYTRFGSQGLYAPTAALFVLVYESYAGFDILHRLLETLLGATIGVCVNALVLPPVHTDRVRRLRSQLPRDCATLLHEVADGIEGVYDDGRVRGWYDRALRLTDVVAELRDARRWSDESFRFNPGHKLRRTVVPPPSADWDLTWDRITEHIRAAIRTLNDATTLPDCVPGILSPLLRSAGDVLDPGSADDRDRALNEMTAAHRRLTAVLADGRYETTPALGALALDTQRLLDDLTTFADARDVPQLRHQA